MAIGASAKCTLASHVTRDLPVIIAQGCSPTSSVTVYLAKFIIHEISCSVFPFFSTLIGLVQIQPCATLFAQSGRRTLALLGMSPIEQSVLARACRTDGSSCKLLAHRPDCPTLRGSLVRALVSSFGSFVGNTVAFPLFRFCDTLN